MGDDRPNVYREGDYWVYRSSSFGNCIKELAAIRAGITPAPFPDRFRKAFDDGNRGEAVIIAMLEAEGWTITRQQEEINWEILPGVIIRGHIDGVANRGSERRIFDAKTTSERYGIADHLQVKYDWQLSLYGHALGLDKAMLGVGIKDPATGDVMRTDTHTMDTLPYSVAQIKARVAKIENLAKRCLEAPDRDVAIFNLECDTTNRYPCFPAGTLVLTDDGYKAIDLIEVGDKVLTHAGRYRPVTATQTTEDAPLREIRAMGVPSLRTTDDHPFLARERYRYHPKRDVVLRLFHEADWVSAEKLERKHFLGQTLPPLVDDDHTAEFWWLIGRYLADGWMHDAGRGPGIFICCAHSEVDELTARIGAAGFTAKRYDERTVSKFRISGLQQGIYKFVQQFGRYAHGKRLSGLALGLEEGRAGALLEGYLSGDGYRTGNKWIATTVSRELGLGMSLLAQRTGRVACLRLCKRSATGVIEGRTVNQRDAYTLSIQDEMKFAMIEDGTAWRPLRTNRSLNERATVFNITVAEDNSYIAEGAIVHNCGVYRFHNDEKPVTVRQDVSEDEIFDGLMAEYEAARDEEAQAKALKEDAKNRLIAHLGGRVPKSTANWDLQWTGTGIKKQLDKKSLEKFLAGYGKKYADFEGTVSVDKSIKVERVDQS